MRTAVLLLVAIVAVFAAPPYPLPPNAKFLNAQWKGTIYLAGVGSLPATGYYQYSAALEQSHVNYTVYDTVTTSTWELITPGGIIEIEKVLGNCESQLVPPGVCKEWTQQGNALVELCTITYEGYTAGSNTTVVINGDVITTVYYSVNVPDVLSFTETINILPYDPNSDPSTDSGFKPCTVN
eukprot:TRINITY_DN9741_c0_g1_i1.p1 TRINITY_DN9741_c0_g1~~TRINITY_DN9741_c0_g1_i1.p1  ORF type:complete len:182 (+),score=39.94 TRINITY_DN9741_c0_g1_i1:89-634(+)